MAELIIFYDGGCPLCVHEMKKLRQLDKRQQLKLEDIHQADFSARYPHIDKQQADSILHGQRPDGKVLYGLDVTHAAWQLVGRGWLTAPLRWPVIRWVADKVYLFFARNRNGISKLLTGKSRCERCSLD